MAGRKSKSRELQWDRANQVMDLTAQGLGIAEIARRLGVSDIVIYRDMKFYAQTYNFFLEQEGRMPHLMAKSNRVIQRAWNELQELKNRLEEESHEEGFKTKPAEISKAVAALLSTLNHAIATQARILGVDQLPEGGMGQLPSVTIIVQRIESEKPKTIDVTPPKPEDSGGLPQLEIKR